MHLRRAALLLLILALPAAAQGPSADWRTLTTPHYRVHYPASSEAWARHAAARLEAVRERVVAEVGYAPPETVDVLISDPLAESNGAAFPILGWPRLVLWTSPPEPQSSIGHYTDWSELLLTHEQTHLVHLLRPSRNPVRRMLSRIAPVGPIALAAPRWVDEGYATLVEGRLTGSGRPNSDFRAALLRRWAEAGKLPTYGRLASDPVSWEGMSMAYLVGSAYLEWLEERAGPGSLRNLWARMTARRARGFDEAFRGVFGDSPADLYDRFRAEVTWRALEAERRLDAAGPRPEGELWQDLSRGTGDPAISPDGKRLAIVLDPAPQSGRRARLVVWSTEPDEKAEESWRKKREEIQRRDPEDVPAVRTGPLPREPLATLEPADGVAPTTPRWLPDGPRGSSILLVRYEPDPEGFLHPDLFLWTPESGELRRLTRGADLREPDPAPDGSWAVAIRQRDGLSQLVRADLTTGEVREITPASVEDVYDRPRVSPDGGRIAFARHRVGSSGTGGVWRLVIRDLATGAETELAPPAEGTFSSAAWSPDGRTVYGVVGLRGFLDLWAFPAAGPPDTDPVRLTRTHGGALAPEPAPDGKAVFFLSLEPDGLDLRRLELPAAPSSSLAEVDLPRELAPAIRPPVPTPPAPLAVVDVPPGRPYRIGRQELLPLIGGSGSSSGGAFEAGLRGGDVIGRLDWLLLGSLSSSGGPEGGALSGIWRGWPVEVGFHVFRAGERPSEQHGGGPGGLDLDRTGVEISARWDRLRAAGAASITGQALLSRIDPRNGPGEDERIAALGASEGGTLRHGRWRLEQAAALHAEEGQTGGDGWTRYGARVRLGVRNGSTGLAVSLRRDDSRDVTRPFDRFQVGGAASSLLPDSVLSGRIEAPALPVGSLLGERHDGERAELRLGFLPAPAFFERHRMDGGDWLSLAGLEWRWSTGPIPVGRVPALDVRVGVARILDTPADQARLDGDNRWWLTVVWRP
jgi:hypothetical protein